MNRITLTVRNLYTKFIWLQTFELYKAAEIYLSRNARFLPRFGVIESLLFNPLVFIRLPTLGGFV